MVQEFQHAALDKGLEFRNWVPDFDEDDMLVTGDLGKIKQVISALIDNAIKFTSQGFIEVRLIVEHESDASVTVRCEVQDTGIGIPKGIKLLEHYGKIDASLSRNRGGTGLGLVTAKRSVDLMRGTLNYASDVGVGSVFWFTLDFDKILDHHPPPVSHEPHVVLPSIPRRNDNIKRTFPKRILVAEDNLTNLRITMRTLRKLGYDGISSTVDGLLAYEMFKQQPFDLVLMDIQMPNMDGYESTIKIREYERDHRSNQHAIIIALTAHGAETKNQALQAGMDDFLTKPFSTTQLINAILVWFPVRP
jgi:CheY-like chemotaxis protein